MQQPPHEQSFHLQPTDEIMAREAQEGPSSRKYGKLAVRFNTYGVTRADAPPSGSNNYTSLTELRPSNLVETSFAHEDDFSRSDKKLQLHDIKAEVRKLKTLHQTRPIPGETWFAIDAKWINNWLVRKMPIECDLLTLLRIVRPTDASLSLSLVFVHE